MRYQPIEEDIVNKNMGSADRRLRGFVAAPVLVVVGVLAGPGGLLALVLYALAAVMLATATVGTCPLYRLFGLRTCPVATVAAPPSERATAR